MCNQSICLMAIYIYIYTENRFGGFGAPGGGKCPLSIDLAYRPYNSVRMHGDKIQFHIVSVYDPNPSTTFFILHLNNNK